MHRRCEGPHFGHLGARSGRLLRSVSAEVIDALVPPSGLTLSVINCQAQHRKGAGLTVPRVRADELLGDPPVRGDQAALPCTSPITCSRLLTLSPTTGWVSSMISSFSCEVGDGLHG
jgi:hypothetical protein